MRNNKRNQSLTCPGSWRKYFLPLLLLGLCGVYPAPAHVQTPQYVGFFELADCTEIAGWAADKNRLNTSITVSIFDGQTLLTTVLANLPRPDVGSGLGDNGLHGFFFLVPDSLKNGQPHSISVKFESTNVDTTNSPRSITCSPPISQPGRTGTGVLLAADLKLNNGAASTNNRIVNLNFSATEVTGASRRDVTSQVTHYRAKEEPDSRDSINELSTQPWLPIERGSLRLELAEHNGFGERYGDRRVAFQVKTATLESKVVSDVITLNPVLKDYHVSGGNPNLTPHPVVSYAASQGFTFPLEYYETCKGECPNSSIADNSLANGVANVNTQALSKNSDNTLLCIATIAGAVVSLGMATAAAVFVCSQRPTPVPAGTCVTKADYLMFEGRPLNQFWHIKSINVTGATVHVHGANSFRLKSSQSISDGQCRAGYQILIGDVVIEGPEVDDFVDPANPWKNAFVRGPVLHPINPGIRHPD